MYIYTPVCISLSLYIYVYIYIYIHIHIPHSKTLFPLLCGACMTKFPCPSRYLGRTEDMEWGSDVLIISYFFII